MQNGKLYTRIVTRRLPTQHGSDVQFLFLAGFETKLTQATAAYYETLSTVTQDNIDTVSKRLQRLASASEVQDITDASVQKRLSKVLDEGKYSFM